MNNPLICKPVVAKIQWVNDLGLSTWFEILIYDNRWMSSFGHNPLDKGEQVIDWYYCDTGIGRQDE